MYHLSRIMYYFGWLLAFGYTATCTVLLFASHVPTSAWWLPLIVIAFFEYGMIKWLNYHKHSAESAWQFYISLLMTIICAIAISLSASLQTATWFGVLLPSWVIGALEGYLIGNMCANILALVGISLTSSAHMGKFEQHKPARVKDERHKNVESLPQLWEADGTLTDAGQRLQHQQTDQLPAVNGHKKKAT